MQKVLEILKKEKFLLLALGLICTVFFFYNLGSYKLIDVDEPRYAEAAREMLSSGDWITPYFNFDLRFDKPVLIYWLIAASYMIFGVTEFAARFPSALLATGLVFLTYYFGRTTLSKNFGFISSIILASSLQFIALSRMSMTDMSLAFFICATIVFGFLGSYVNENQRKYWWWLAYLFSGLSILTKGPVGFILPAMVFGIYFILSGKLKQNLKLIYIIPGILLMLAVSTPWYYLIIQEHGMNFINYFFLKHNFARFASSNFGQHSQPFYFYIIVILAGFFPWTLFLLSSIYKSFQKLINYLKNNKTEFKSSGLALFKNADNKLTVYLFLLVWFLTIFIFFSASRAKLLTYILPVFPAIALLTGVLWHDYFTNNENRKSVITGTVIFIALSFILAAISQFGLNLILPKDAKIMVGKIGILPVFLFTVIPLLALIFNRIKAISFALIVIFMTGVLYIGVNKVLPIIYQSGPSDLYEFSQYYKNAKLSDKQLVSYGLSKPSIVFYSQSKVNFTDNINEVQEYLNSEKPVFVLYRNKSINELASLKNYKLVKKGIRFSLITND